MSTYGLLYQIYNVHPVYGADILVYIGQANKATFGDRFREGDRDWMKDDHAPWDDNTCRIRIHIGRIHMEQGAKCPQEDERNTWIDRAEALLIACPHADPERLPRRGLASRPGS